MATFDFDTIWKEVLDKIEESQYFSEDTFKNWIRKTNLFKIENQIAYVSYRSKITFSYTRIV